MLKYLKRKENPNNTSYSTDSAKKSKTFPTLQLGKESFHPYETFVRKLFLYIALFVHTLHSPKRLKFMTWNVASLKSLMTKEKTLAHLLEAEEPVAICLQETKFQNLDSITQSYKHIIPNYTGYFNHCKARKGYSGTAIYVRNGFEPMQIIRDVGQEEHDQEGRVITLEFPNFYLINTYIPNSGEELKRLDYRTQKWDQAMKQFVQKLSQTKPILWLGDLNVAHLENDVYNPKQFKNKSAGFCDVERNNFSTMLQECKLIDAFRFLHPSAEGASAFTYYSYLGNMRSKEKGWRIDYALVSEELKDKIEECYLRRDVLGSDHVPLSLVLQFEPRAQSAEDKIEEPSKIERV